MTDNSSDDPSTDEANEDVDEVEIARVVEQYFEPSTTVSEDELRKHLQRDVNGVIVDLETEGVGITVTVERKSEEGDQPLREAYNVQRVTDLDENLSLDWKYLGTVD